MGAWGGDRLSKDTDTTSTPGELNLGMFVRNCDGTDEKKKKFKLYKEMNITNCILW